MQRLPLPSRASTRPGSRPPPRRGSKKLLGRSPSVLELEVYAALLRGPGVDLSTEWPLRVGLGPDVAVVLTVASGRCAGVEAALGLVAAGTALLTVVLGLPGDGPGQGAAAERAEADRLGVAVTAVPTGAATEVMGLAVGLVDQSAGAWRAPAAGDALIYLGAPTGREGLGGATPGGFCPPPGEAAPTQTLALLRALQPRPGLILRVQAVGKGGLAQAAAGLAVGSQLLLDAVPRHPVLLHPNELLLAETSSRALIVVPADRGRGSAGGGAGRGRGGGGDWPDHGGRPPERTDEAAGRGRWRGRSASCRSGRCTASSWPRRPRRPTPARPPDRVPTSCPHPWRNRANRHRRAFLLYRAWTDRGLNLLSRASRDWRARCYRNCAPRRAKFLVWLRYGTRARPC